MQRARRVLAFALLGGWSAVCSASCGSDSSRASVSFLAFGDVNLGRYVGKKLLQGDTLFPFRKMLGTLTTADMVFVNLESQLSDQHGETQDPKNNLVFTGPPEGGATLMKAGVTVVSTANNHAFDYGIRALKETIASLDSSKLWHVGTETDSCRLYVPLVRTVSGVRFAFFAVTSVMNSQSRRWRPFIALADSGKLFPAIRSVRDSVDVVIVSYHGDCEYTPGPTVKQKRFFRQMVDAGVDIVIGHHSHVPQGVELYKQGWLVYSLGNFVFSQPQHYWTQRSIGIRWDIEKAPGRARITEVSLVPLGCGFQPAEMKEAKGRREILDRLETLSNVLFPWSACDPPQIR